MNISHEEKKEEGNIFTETGLQKLRRSTDTESSTLNGHLRAPTPPSRPHSHPCHERHSLLLPTDAGVSQPPSSTSPFNTSVVDITTVSSHKSRRRPVTLGSLDDFSPSSGNAVPKSSSPPSSLSLPKAKDNSQGWLWLKKRYSASFGNRYVKRWCVFKHNTLYYYRSKEETNAEGLILLHGFTISPLATEGVGRSGRYPFRVYNEWTRFVFAADSEGARTRWMNMLGLAAIGQSACLWTSPIGGFHPGYLPSLSSTKTRSEAMVKNETGVIEANPLLLEPPKSEASDVDNKSRRQLVVSDFSIPIPHWFFPLIPGNYYWWCC